MSDQFQHVMVLASIIVGLGITHLLTGVAHALDRSNDHEQRMRIGFAHTVWLIVVFIWMVIFWWWEYRLLELVQSWTLIHYFFLVLYAVLLYLLAAVLIPRDWNKVVDLDAYFISQRHWFFAAYLLATVADVVDSYMKGGWGYIASLGPITNFITAATIPIVIVGIRSTSVRTHSVMALFVLAGQIFGVFQSSPRLT